MASAQRRRIWLVALALLAALLLVGVARAVTPHWQDDTLWRNALASAGGTQRPGDFGYVFLPAANQVLEGQDPYMSALLIPRRRRPAEAYEQEALQMRPEAA